MMQNQSHNDSLAHWVNPGQKNNYTKKAIKKQHDTRSNLTGFESSHMNTRTSSPKRINSNLYQKDVNNNNQIREDAEQEVCGKNEFGYQIDLSSCRTIAAFVDEHLKDLELRQNAINKARSRLTSGNNMKAFEIDQKWEQAYQWQSEILKLRVRDEQTKAIETIKRLTNYLRELTLIKQNCDHVTSASFPMNEAICMKVASMRANIIQALNDFVIMNNDIEAPLEYLDRQEELDSSLDSSLISAGCDVNKSRSSEQFSNNSFQVISSTSWKNGSEGENNSSMDNSWQEIHSECSLKKDQQQKHQENIAAKSLANRRRRELERLERDSEELKGLFTHFYTLIQSQTEQVSSIELDIDATQAALSRAEVELSGAAKLKRLSLLMPLTGCVTGALLGGPLGLVIGGKLGGITIGCVTSLIGLLSSFSAQQYIRSKADDHQIKRD